MTSPKNHRRALPSVQGGTTCRLFPAADDLENETKQREMDMKYGVMTINEVRA